MRTIANRGGVLVFKERAGKPGGGKGILIGEDKAFTLATQMIDAVCYAARIGSVDTVEQYGGQFEDYRGGALQSETLRCRDYKGGMMVAYVRPVDREPPR